MTIHAFTPPVRMARHTKRTYIPTSKPSADRWIGVGLCAMILAVCCMSAFTSGLSVSAGGVEMNLSGSLSQGMQIHFAAINS